MRPMAERLESANQLLAPYAIPHQGQLGRTIAEPDDETRFPFQRDRDRIIHTLAFRRLKGKTQVFVARPESSDHHRTRLTHTMEVAQVSRDMARTLGLNEDLAECIALAHDLGHPPFGHAGQDALDAWMQGHGLRFEHNLQSYRIVTLLERHAALYQGLNLNKEVLEGLLKHRTPHDHPESEIPRAPSMEAQVVNIADEIAYTSHDVDDGLRAGLFNKNDLMNVSLAKQAVEKSLEKGTSTRGAIIHFLVSDIYASVEKILASHRVSTVEQVYASTSPLVAFSKPMRTALDELRGFLWKQMYLHPSIAEANEEGKGIITTLCDRLHAAPSEQVLLLQRKTDGALPEAVKDYVAGMTDEFARRQAAGEL